MEMPQIKKDTLTAPHLESLIDTLGIRFFVLTALLVATVGLFEAHPRYEVVGPQLNDHPLTDTN